MDPFWLKKGEKRDGIDRLLERMGVIDPEQPEPKAEVDLESFRRPDGSVDAATLPDMPKEKLQAIEQDNNPRRRPRPVERFAFQPGAKMTNVRGLGGDEVQPVSEDAAVTSLEQLSGKAVKPRLLGPDSGEVVPTGDLETLRGRMRGYESRGPTLSGSEAPTFTDEENKLPPRKGSFWDPAYQALPPDPHAIPRRSEQQANTPLREPPSTIKFADLMKPEQGTPEDYGSPFPDRQGQETTTDPLGLRDQYKKQQLERARRDAGFAVTQMNGDAAIHGPDPEKLAKLRKDAAGAVGAMKADETEHVQDADFGRVEAKVKEMSKPKAALQKFQASKGPAPLPGPGDSGADRPQFDKPFDQMLAEQERGPASPRQPLQAAQQLMTGAAPDTSKEEAEMDAAAKARDQELLLAQIATNFGHYSDVLGGTQGPDRGKGIRDNASRTLEILKQKRGLRSDAADKATEMEDRKYERAGIDQQRAATGAKTQRDADFNDAASQKSRQARTIATSLYPKLVARIPPAEFQKMSGADIASFLAEAQPEKVGGAGKGGGLSGAQLNSVRNKIPANLKDTSDALDRANEAIEAIGGWDKMQVGGLGGATPTMFLDPDQADVRQTLAGVAQAFLSSGAGKSITKQEREILLGMSGADSEKFMTNPAVFKRGMAIIEHRMQNAARQALAGVDEADQDKLLNDENGMGVKKDWIRGKADKVNPKAPVKPMKRKLRNPKTGQEIEIDD